MGILCAAQKSCSAASGCRGHARGKADAHSVEASAPSQRRRRFPWPAFQVQLHSMQTEGRNTLMGGPLLRACGALRHRTHAGIRAASTMRHPSRQPRQASPDRGSGQLCSCNKKALPWKFPDQKGAVCGMPDGLGAGRQHGGHPEGLCPLSHPPVRLLGVLIAR